VCRIQANIRFELNDFGMNAIALLSDAQYLHSRIVTKKETGDRIPFSHGMLYYVIYNPHYYSRDQHQSFQVYLCLMPDYGKRLNAAVTANIAKHTYKPLTIKP
jgi:hypothetical protein